MKVIEMIRIGQYEKKTGRFREKNKNNLSNEKAYLLTKKHIEQVKSR